MAAAFEPMTVFVATGCAIGIALQSRVSRARASGILMRPLAGAPFGGDAPLRTHQRGVTGH